MEAYKVVDERLVDLADLGRKLAESDPHRNLSSISGLLSGAHAVSEASRSAGLVSCSQFASALEALLLKIHLQPKKATPSCARTIEQSLELLPQLAASLSVRDREFAPSPLILVVDDSELSRQVLLAALETVQLRAISLGDPAQAFALLEGNTFDLILLDVNMPGMSGIELCQKIKALESNMQTPVVFVDGLKDPDVILESVGSGGVGYVTKPVMLQEISLKTLIHLHQSTLRRIENES